MRLDSWQDIADYLGRNVRTVARWERERGLPVHRAPGGGAIFEFGADLTLRRSGVTDTCWTWHRELESEGRISHTSAQCPDQRGLSVQQWTPGVGLTPVGGR